jgi:hypothetical protein
MPPEYLKLRINPSSNLHPEGTIVIESPTPLERFDTTALHLYVKIDTLWYNADYKFRRMEENIRKYEITAEWKLGTEYSLEIDSAAVTDIYGLSINAVKQGLKVPSEDEYSSLVINLSGLNDTASVVVQLLNSSDAAVRQAKAEEGTAEFNYLTPGKYYIRAFVDSNGNGLWDTGNYDEDRQAEAVYYYPRETECKAKFDITRNWNLNEQPRFKQKPQEIVKQKPDQQKKLKNRNLDRAKELGKEYIRKSSGMNL